MTREEAIETVDAVDYFGMNTDHKVELSKEFINKIYDDFESRTCESCGYWNPEILVHGAKNGYKKKIKSCEWLQVNTSKNFGCNQWEQK